MRKRKAEKGHHKQNAVTKVVLLCLLASILCAPAAFCGEKWRGVDESVVEKYAQEHGRTAHAPLINTDQGDLLLFVFLLAGTAGGFAAGYYWRMLIAEKSRDGANRDAAQ
jgi:hypothetical protein